MLRYQLAADILPGMPLTTSLCIHIQVDYLQFPECVTLSKILVSFLFLM